MSLWQKILAAFAYLAGRWAGRKAQRAADAAALVALKASEASAAARAPSTREELGKSMREGTF